MASNPRSLETRASSQRKQSWKPASILPVPDAQDGVSYRWIRTGSRGSPDMKNVSARFREGWEPVAAKDHPELQIRSDDGSRFADGVEVGGLLLCKTSSDNVKQREEYYRNFTQNQIASVDQAYMRQNDPRMPLYKPERKSRTTFGNDE